MPYKKVLENNAYKKYYNNRVIKKLLIRPDAPQTSRYPYVCQNPRSQSYQIWSIYYKPACFITEKKI